MRWAAWAVARGKQLNDDDIPREVPKPYTTPSGFRPPTLGEQWRYAVLKHPYYRYGYSLAIAVGILGYVMAPPGGEKNSKEGGGAAQPPTPHAAEGA